MNKGENDHKKAPQSTVTDDLAQTIDNHINEGTLKANSIFSSARIYRVPEELRKGKESAYTPRLVAIGPLHCNDKLLKPMQDVKKCYTDRLIRRVTKGLAEGPVEREKRFKVLQDCVEELKNCIDVAKKFYAEIVMPAADQEREKEVTQVDKAKKHEEEGLSLSDDYMLEMMLVDGCFILELLYKNRSSPFEPEDHIPKEESSDLSTPLLKAARLWNPKRRRNGGVHGQNTSSNRKHLDPIFDRCLPLTTVLQDLVLLENQIPFFVLEKLFKHTVEQIPNRPESLDKYSLPEYVSLYFGDIMTPQGACQENKKEENPERNSTHTETTTGTSCGSAGDCVLSMSGNKLTKSGVDKKQNYDHILHKLHEDHRPVAQTNDKESLAQKDKKKLRKLIPNIPCASELEYAGVKFVPGKGNNILKVKFTKPTGPFWWCRRARFEIPPLEIYDQTELFLRNLIAYEQCCPRDLQISSFTTYAYLMDMLVNSDKDIQVLEKAEVMSNYLGSTEYATDLFNNLGKETAVDVGEESVFADLCDEALEYSKWRWPRNLAHIRRTYFASPWTFIALCVGFITFGIAVASFFLSFL